VRVKHDFFYKKSSNGSKTASSLLTNLAADERRTLLKALAINIKTVYCQNHGSG
jgi:hypothetical protein